ncbi:MAG: TetR/AcrR family transcriptional regulator [Corynebacterium sp.]|uniref:TetR/AcrR family transcriptional regulator n=1 Tax=Corynebacterium sp. TaxID=1720 RepID=UPI00270AF7E3|nr:TetR/AcrR family transcriptional regulator [Corynebacterium sp.]
MDDELLLPRRRPAQARSRERFDRILQASRSVLVDVGFESFTFDEVAKRAEVPIGTIYQFFANKYSLICELDRVDTAQAVNELHRFSRQVPALQWPEILSEFIDHLAKMWREDPSRRAVWHAMQSTPSTRHTGAHTEREVIEIIADILRPLNRTAAYADRRRLAGFLVHTVSSMLNYAVRDLHERGEEYFNSVVNEVKRMLVAYLFAVATN